MSSPLEISGVADRHRDDGSSSGSDNEMQELGDTKHFRDAAIKPGIFSALYGHIDSIAAVITTLGLSAAVWLQFSVIYPIIFPQHLMDQAHPSKKGWSKQQCDSADNLDRARAFGDTCPCWDGKFKGTYSLDKKSVMFNIEAESLGIYALTVLFTCITYSGFKTILQNFFEGHLRLGALLPVAANVHGVYYHWYVSFTYMNESWYYYWYSQWIFGITEFMVMYILFLRLDTRYQLKCEHAAAVIAIATFHSSQGMFVQAIDNIVNWRGIHLVSRDLAFIFAEVFAAATIISDARSLATNKGRSILTMWPHFLRNTVGGFVCLWLLLSFTEFSEVPKRH